MFETIKEAKELDEMFHGEPKPLHPDTIYQVSSVPGHEFTAIPGYPPKTSTKEEPKEETQQDSHKPTHNYNGKSWEPVKEPNWMDNLKGCAKWAIGFGGLSFLLFYWEQAGLMAESIAVPCMCLCTALAGWGVGKTVRCK